MVAIASSKHNFWWKTTNLSNPFEVGFFDIGDLPESVAVSGGLAYVALPRNGLYLIQNDLLTALDPHFSSLPEQFQLMQNYPNPFNPKTVISWQLPVGSNVEISIYNILGQKIETLLNKYMPAGYHEIKFNGQNLPSGIYLYRIEAGEWTDVKKMLLVK